MPRYSATHRTVTPSPPQLLRPAEVADILGVTTRTVRALASSGELQKVRLSGRAVRYLAADVEHYIARHTVPSPSYACADSGSTPTASSRRAHDAGAS